VSTIVLQAAQVLRQSSGGMVRRALVKGESVVSNNSVCVNGVLFFFPGMAFFPVARCGAFAEDMLMGMGASFLNRRAQKLEERELGGGRGRDLWLRWCGRGISMESMRL
jgi:hypothetical protein